MQQYLHLVHPRRAKSSVKLFFFTFTTREASTVSYADMDFSRFVDGFLADAAIDDWSGLNRLRYLENRIQFLLTAKMISLMHLNEGLTVFVSPKPTGPGARAKAVKLFKNAEDTFQRKEIMEFFEEIDRKFEARKNDREVYKSVDVAKVVIAKTATSRLVETLETEGRSIKRRKTEEYGGDNPTKRIDDDCGIGKAQVILGRTRQQRSVTILHQPTGNSDNEETSDSSYRSSTHSSDSEDSVEQSCEGIEWMVGIGSEESALPEGSKQELWMAVVDDIEKQIVPYRLSDDDILQCHAVSETASHTSEDCKPLLRKWQQAGENTLTEFFESVGACVETFFRFKQAARMQLVNRYIGCIGTSETKIRSFALGQKPDFSVFTSAKNKKEFLFVTEVESPKHRGPEGLFNGLFNDKAKLGNLMKDSLDKVIDDGVENKDVVVCGLLKQGLRCSLYAIDLRYDGVYRMITLGRFFLPRDNHDFWIIVTHTCEICVKSLRTSKFKAEVVSNEQVRVDIERREEGKSSRTPPRKLMVRNSYHTPIKVQSFDRRGFHSVL
ncbi:hypothetical protein BC936DRAFT_148032 [Jimgerdemannia flammicorona]|uniref:Uncharacterized protein n=1 Tax=Jimgerdemannia flammicorona TaxID=994334 RepID=A0A433D3V8_9FUNG|nr:hypothetical protein BC936DRAFT_148032 [Jimgerdemannia flammicorona]